jgi:DNA-binding NtrC family response regulator
MPLVNYFLPKRTLSHSAEHTLLRHSWPGNVRELENACKRIAVLKPSGIIEAEDFSFIDNSFSSTSSLANSHAHEKTAEPSKEDLLAAMREHEGVIARVARQFSMSRQALYRRLNKHGIEY